MFLRRGKASLFRDVLELPEDLVDLSFWHIMHIMLSVQAASRFHRTANPTIV